MPHVPKITISIAHKQDGSDATGELNVLSLGFGLFLAWIFTAVYGTTFVFGASTIAPGLIPVSESLSATLTVSYMVSTSIVLLLIGVTNQLLLRFYVSRRALVFASSLGCIGTLLMIASPYVGTPAAILSGACIGTGSSVMIALWGTAFARYEFTTIILNATLATVISVAAFICLTHWIIPPLSGFLTAFLPIVVALLLWKVTPVPYYIREEIPIFHPLAIRKTAFLLRFGLPAIAIGFSVGAVRKIALSNVMPATDLTSQLIMGAAACVSVLIVVATVAASRDESHWDSVFRVVIPIVATAIFCFPLLSGEYHLLSCFIITGGFICFEALVWIFFSDLSQEFRLSPIYVFGIGCGMISIGMFISFLYFDLPLAGAYTMTPLFTLEDSLLLMLALVIGYAVLPRKRDIRRLVLPMQPNQDGTDHLREKVVSHTAEIQQSSGAVESVGAEQAEAEEGVHTKGRFHVKCEEIADRYLLSRRETEVMFLLAKGHNAAFIQDKLCISKSTAKTHINHIYRKLDIHTQQELLNMMEDEPAEPSTPALSPKLGAVSKHMKPISSKKS